MDSETKVKIMLGEAKAEVAEAWFKLLGFMAATGIIHAAADRSDNAALIAVKWISYVLIFCWVQYRTDKAAWLLFPSADPRRTGADAARIAITVAISSTAVMVGYILITRVINALLTPARFV